LCEQLKNNNNRNKQKIYIEREREGNMVNTSLFFFLTAALITFNNISIISKTNADHWFIRANRMKEKNILFLSNSKLLIDWLIDNRSIVKKRERRNNDFWSSSSIIIFLSPTMTRKKKHFNIINSILGSSSLWQCHPKQKY